MVCVWRMTALPATSPVTHSADLTDTHRHPAPLPPACVQTAPQEVGARKAPVGIVVAPAGGSRAGEVVETPSAHADANSAWIDAAVAAAAPAATLAAAARAGVDEDSVISTVVTSMAGGSQEVVIKLDVRQRLETFSRVSTGATSLATSRGTPAHTDVAAAAVRRSQRGTTGSISGGIGGGGGGGGGGGSGGGSTVMGSSLYRDDDALPGQAPGETTMSLRIRASRGNTVRRSTLGSGGSPVVRAAATAAAAAAAAAFDDSGSGATSPARARVVGDRGSSDYNSPVAAGV